MAKKEVVTKEETKEVKKESMKYVLTMPDGTVIEGSTSLRAFQVNTQKGFQNSGFQVKVNDGNYGGNIMIIDYLKQKRI